ARRAGKESRALDFPRHQNLHHTQTRQSFWKSRSAIMKDDKDNIELSAVEDHDGILTIRGGGARRDWNGIHYKQGMSAKNVGTKSLSANIATIPPGAVAYAHIHVGFEVILYILKGKVSHEFGHGLKQATENKAGDFMYI